MEKKAERSYGLDVLKIFATIAIVFHHFQQDFNISFSNHINFFGDWFYWGYMVELFFILSGYFMYKYIKCILDGELSLAQWMGRRLKRLLPLVAVSAFGYELLYAMYWYMTGEYWAWGRSVSIWGVVITGLGLQEGGAFFNPHVNNVTWYVSVLIICYVMFYLLISLAKKIKCQPYYLFFLMVMLGISILTYEINLPYLNNAAARGYRGFFFGLLLAQFIKSYGISRREIVSCIIITGILLALFAYKPELVKGDLDNILCFLLYPCIILIFESKAAKKLFSNSFWGVWGQVSFDVYVWHVVGYFLFDIVLYQTGYTPDFTNPLYMYAFLVAIELFGVFSYYFIEKPLNRFVDRILDNFKGRRIINKTGCD